MRKAAFVYNEAVSQHILHDDHVMRPTRLRYTYELLESYGAFRDSSLVSPRHATEEELLWFHTPQYVEAVRSLSRDEGKVVPEHYNFSHAGDNPPYPGMYEAATLSTGASVVAAELVATGEVEVAFNVAGGLHHAAPDHASGFCIFNDPVIAIEYFRRRGMRVLYVDIDCHHGDGVQNAFYDTDQVMTISVHESGRFLFPGTGEVEELGSGAGKGYSVNLPLAPYTSDEVFHWAVMEVAPPLAEAFKPDVLVTQLGIDTHFNDPITHLRLTVEGHARVVAEMGKLAGRWLALGGGGYDMAAVARGWSLDYGGMMGVSWPDPIPDSYRERYGLTRLRDGGAPPIAQSAEDDVRRSAQATVEQIQRTIFPLHEIG